MYNNINEVEMQIYIGNLPLEYTDAELKKMFEEFGIVKEAKIGRSKKTNESEGYGLVVMAVKSEAREAVESLRGKEIQGKPLRVKILKPGDTFHMQETGRSGIHLSKSTGTFRGTSAIRRGGQRGS
jgi:RNA-binding proteins (RRM domain)